MPQASGHSTSTVLSPFHNLSLGELVDQLGHAKAEAAGIKAREEALKAELTARGVTEAEGALFRATVSEAARWTLDAAVIREEMGEAWCDKRSKVTATTTVRVSARKGVKLAVAA
jgi:hypothetical protein